MEKGDGLVIATPHRDGSRKSGVEDSAIEHMVLRCNKRTWQWFAAVMMAVLATGGGCGGCGGCGCSSSPSSRIRYRVSGKELDQLIAEQQKERDEEAEAAREEHKKKKAEEARKKKEREEKRKAAMAERQAKAAAAKQTATKPKVEVPPRPEDVAEWKDQDYFNARTLGDPKLAEAAEYLGRTGVGKQEVAELLVRLLRADKKAKPLSAETVRAIVGALSANGTTPARRALEEILSGSLVTDSAEVGTQAALEALGELPRTESEDILFKALVDWAAGMSTEKNRERATNVGVSVLESMPIDQAERFRVRLARHIVSFPTPGQTHAQLWKLIEEPRLDNLPAQVFLYQEYRTPASTRGKIEGYLLLYTRDIVRRLMGLPDPPALSAAMRERRQTARKGGGGEKKRAPKPEDVLADPEFLSRVTPQVLGPEFLAFLSHRMNRVNSLGDAQGVLALAALAPVDTMRSEIIDVLRRNWQDGPGVLDRAGLAGSAMWEPGFLLAMKAFVRDQVPPGSLDESVTKTAAPELLAAREKRAELERQWVKFSADLLLTFKARLDTAWRSKGQHWSAPAASPSEATLEHRFPIDLHEGARVLGFHRLAWPSEGQETVLGLKLDPITVNYVRIEETSRFKPLLHYYRRQFGPRREILTEKGVWLESVRDIKETGRTRSFDLIITKAQPGTTFETLDQAEKLTVELLSIEAADPDRPRHAAAESVTDARPEPPLKQPVSATP